MLIEIAMNLEPEDIINLCRSAPALRRLCTDNNFWRRKLYKDYGIEVRMNALAVYRALYGGYTTFQHPEIDNIGLVVEYYGLDRNWVILTYRIKEGDRYHYFPDMAITANIMAMVGPSEYQSYQETPDHDEGKDYLQEYSWETVTDDQTVQLIKYAVDNGYVITAQNTEKKQEVPNGVGREQQ